jgi:hypothetical protein
MDDTSNITAALPAVGGGQVASKPGAITSPKPPPMLELTPAEGQLYEHICETLRQAGIEHLTASMPIAIIVRTFADWLAACERCDREGRTQTSKTGWATPTPWADDEKRLKMELGQWLPKACLTIPSLARVRKDTGESAKQDDLFAELVSHGTTSPARALRH